MNGFRKSLVGTFVIAVLMSSSSFAEPVLTAQLDGFAATRPVEYYTPDSLYELINGQAVFYLSYGFDRLEHTFYGKGDAVYQVDVYSLRDGLAALGCFRQQMDQESDALDAGAEGAIIGYLTTFHKDRYYVEIIPEGSGDTVIPDMRALAALVAVRIPGDDSLPKEIAWFPSDGLVAGSEMYTGENLLSYSFLGHGLTAEYQVPESGGTFRVFISLADSPDAAESIVQEFTGRLETPEPLSLTDGFSGNTGVMPYRGQSMIFAVRSFAIGALGVSGRAQAMRVLSALSATLAGVERN